MLVRAADIPEYVQDEVVDCGVTGADLVEESGVSVDVLLGLGFGACTLEAAVPAESSATTLDDLVGARVATVYPNLAERLLGERGVEVELVRVTGSVEVAPRLGLADAIVDLVSSGSTLRTNGLRSLGALLSSEAVLIARRGSDDRARRDRDRSAQCRRGARHAIPHAQRSQERARRDLPDRARLAVAERRAARREGMVALQALVPAADVWRLLPQLEAAGASSILLVPVERMLR